MNLRKTTKTEDAASQKSSAFILVAGSIGVVIFHLLGSRFYIGSNFIDPSSIRQFLQNESIFRLAVELFNGFSAIVGLFFINSGYGLSKSNSSSNLKTFYINRLKKIYLFALAAAILCTVAALLIEHRLVYSYWSSFIPLQGLYWFHQEWPVSQYWFLSLIFVYYLVFPFLEPLSTPKLILTAAGIFLAYLILTESTQSNWVDNYHSVFFRFPEFALGICIARHKKLEHFFFSFSFKGALSGLAIFILGYVCLFSTQLNYVSLFLTSVGSYLFLSQIAQALYRFAYVSRLFLILSRGSFSLYLFHLITVRYVYAAFKQFTESITGDLSYGLFLLLSYAIIFGFSMALLYLGGIIETRYQRIIS